MKTSCLHKHRILPGHMGGTYEPNNVVLLTVKQHAEAHKVLYEQHGRWQDRLAWYGLAGIIGSEEVVLEVNRQAHMKDNPTRFALAARRYREHKRNGTMPLTNSQAHSGKKASEETKRKMRIAHLGRTHTLEVITHMKTAMVQSHASGTRKPWGTNRKVA